MLRASQENENNASEWSSGSIYLTATGLVASVKVCLGGSLTHESDLGFYLKTCRRSLHFILYKEDETCEL